MLTIPRMRIRTALILVALVAICLGVWLDYERRSGKNRRISDDHIARANDARTMWRLPTGRSYLVRRAQSEALTDYHTRLAAKYRWAAHNPWRNIPPDPPPPDILSDPAKLRRAVMQFIADNIKVTNGLDFSDVPLTDAELAILCKREDLITLTICGPYVSFDGLMSLKVLPNLKILSLINCTSEEGAFALAREFEDVVINY